jgi:polyhydroxybutyrate depolymerase
MPMSKLFTAFWAIVMLLALCSCAPSAQAPEQSPPPETAAQPSAPAPTQTPEPTQVPEPTQAPMEIPLGETAKVGELACGRELYRYRGQDVSRLYYYYIPSTYQAGERLPLMLTLHGSGSNASIQLQWGDWVSLAEREGFIVVAPEAVTIHRDGALSSEGKSVLETGQTDFNYIRWNVSYTDPCAQYLVDDVAYLTDLVDLFVDAGYADPQRAYCCGMSHGGFMSLRLAVEAPEKFAGVASVAGLLCAEYAAQLPAQPVRVVFIQGSQDPVVPIGGMHYDFDNDGEQEYTWALSLDESAAWFVQRSGASDEAEYSQLPDAAPNDGTRISRYAYCAGQTPQVVKYVVEGGGHTWPGGTAYAGSGPVSLDAQASQLIWAELRDAVRQDDS